MIRISLVLTFIFLSISAIGFVRGSRGLGETARLLILYIGLLIQQNFGRHLRIPSGKLLIKNQKKLFSFINVFGFILLPLMFITTSWLDFANYALPVRVVHGGVLISLTGLWLMWQSHIDLSEHWSPVAEIQPNHTLVKTGLYRFIRHPI